MKIKFYNHIAKEIEEVDVQPQVANYLESQRKKVARNKAREARIGIISLNELEEKGIYLCEEFDIDEEVEKRTSREKYLNSIEYKKFRNEVRKEISRNFNKMSKRVQQAMFLRFYRNYTISQIAKTLKITKGAAQEYLRRGTVAIKTFLENDIKEQDRLDRLNKEKMELEKIKKLFK